MIKLEFPGEPLVKVQVQSLIGELNSYKPWEGRGRKTREREREKDGASKKINKSSKS